MTIEGKFTNFNKETVFLGIKLLGIPTLLSLDDVNILLIVPQKQVSSCIRKQRATF